LVDHNESAWFLFRVSRLIAYEVLELDDLFDFSVGKAALGFDEFLALFGGGVEEARINLAVDKNISSLHSYQFNSGSLTSSRIPN
jgi:hypothetical protein